MSLRACLRACLAVAASTPVLAAGGCARGSDFEPGYEPELVGDAGGDGTDGATRVPLPGSDSGGLPAADGSTPRVDGGADDGGPVTPGPVDAGCGKSVLVLNEVQVAGGSASEEFVELYNPGSCAVPLSGFRLAYRSRSDGEGPSLYTFTAGDTLAAGAYFVLGTTQFSGAKNATFSAGMAGDGGQIALLDTGGAILDAVGYGSASGRYTERRAAPDPGTSSIGRTPNGKDSDDNAADFMKLALPTPGRAN